MHRKEAAAINSNRVDQARVAPYRKHRNGGNSTACVTIKAKASGNETLLSELASTAIASASCKLLKSMSGFPWPRIPVPFFP